MRNLRFDICADDFGLNANVNAAIVDLVRMGQVQHVSVLIEQVKLEDLAQLKIYSSQILIGLHLDIFSKGLFLTFAEIIIFPERISTKINIQLELFVKLLGHMPHFIDGHMHCHIYPGITFPLLTIISKNQFSSNFYLRSIIIPKVLKSNTSVINKVYLMWISFLNYFFLKKIKKFNLKSNAGTWGAFNRHLPIQNIYELCLQHSQTDDILFIHPAIANFDNINRKGEYLFFKNRKNAKENQKLL